MRRMPPVHNSVFPRVRHTFNILFVMCPLGTKRAAETLHRRAGGRKLATFGDNILDHEKPELTFPFETGSYCVVLAGLELAV